ncbi:asparagine synthase-related protein [Bacillus velezensis]|uniref:asparagine synthase-related protein n=1 Tax=Bacillus velezensis TaxID=492670 RepID=UPI001F3B59D0|nr:asparagine synthase-related protein [Bacillus velezensis]
MISIKWFLASFSSDNNVGRQIEIQKAIFNQYKISTKLNSASIHNCKFYIASNKELESICTFKNVILIGDICIHNKEELLEKLNIMKPFNISDEKLICILYREKGIKLINDLVGTFSFILYDKNNDKVYAVRDQLGIKTLFWTKQKNETVIASDIFLLNDQSLRRDLNKVYFKEFYQRNGIIDSELTPYKHVFRLSSGSFLEIRNGKERVERYWDLTNIKDNLRYSNETDYFEHFVGLLKISTENRMKKGKNNSIMLSGGLDSTSIYALAKMSEDNKQKITPVSAVFDELKECDERDLISGLLKKYNDEAIYLNFDNLLMFERFPNGIPFSDEPSVNCISFDFTYQIVKKSVQYGFDNILSGYAGDHLLTGSLHATRDMIEKGQLKKAFSYLTNYSIATNTSAFQNFIEFTLFPNIPKHFISDTNSEYYSQLTNKFKKINNKNQQEFYYQISNAKSHLYTDRVIGALTGSDIHHPFLDRRLVEFMYNVPGEIRFSDVNPKYILRRSMESYLTSDITSKINKTTHIAYTYKSIRANWDKIYDFMKDAILAEELKLISVDYWREELDRWRNGVKVSDYFWTLFSIELWLKQYYNLIKK